MVMSMLMISVSCSGRLTAKVRGAMDHQLVKLTRRLQPYSLVRYPI